MAQNPPGATAKLESVDPVWSQLRREAEELCAQEPALASFVYATILNHQRVEDAICHRLAQRLSHTDVDVGLVHQTFQEVLRDNPGLGDYFRADLAATFDRDPACNRLIEPLLYFKGFHVLQTHRFAHELWKAGRKDYALYLQSQSSSMFGVDIHPAAEVGRGIMFDHATGIVVGETAKISDDVSILHGVTLGGSGKVSGDRHPKIGRCVMIGAGAKILGNISVGDCARIAAGSVVLKDVPPNTTVAGVPARVVGQAGCPEPARTMEQILGIEEEGTS
ncbi:MAG: serine O-acetyltransferase [Alphaproteobacteria bacterium]|nr:MAG: serine O-acetyltransferase [Alphaproteobacteria bacterium]